MRVAGLDFSITSPALCVYNSDEDHYTITSWTQEERLAREAVTSGKLTASVEYIERNKGDDFYFRLPEKIAFTIIYEDAEAVGVENYAFSANGKITVLAECLGVLKYLYRTKAGDSIIPVAIPHGKMCSNEKMMGNVGKYTSIEYLLSNYAESDFLDKINLKITDETPLSDWCDSFGVCRFIYFKTLYERGETEKIPTKILKSLKKRG